jgi:hypothetical protein
VNLITVPVGYPSSSSRRGSSGNEILLKVGIGIGMLLEGRWNCGTSFTTLSSTLIFSVCTHTSL